MGYFQFSLKYCLEELNYRRDLQWIKIKCFEWTQFKEANIYIFFLPIVNCNLKVA